MCLAPEQAFNKTLLNEGICGGMCPLKSNKLVQEWGKNQSGAGTKVTKSQSLGCRDDHT